jgi:hypothetical protein
VSDVIAVATFQLTVYAAFSWSWMKTQKKPNRFWVYNGIQSGYSDRMTPAYRYEIVSIVI